MSILWIYDKPIDPQAGGTERVTHLVMTGLARRGYRTAGFLSFKQNEPREIVAPNGERVDDLDRFLRENSIEVVINQIGFDPWLLEEFLARGGQGWRDEGGRIVTCMHFGPGMFLETVWALTRGWLKKTLRQKLRRLGRIAMLPLTHRNVTNKRKQAYGYLIDASDVYVILSETHRDELVAMSGTRHPERVRVIPNPNTFATALPAAGVGQKSRTVLIVSRLEETQKRVSLALRAWKRVMTLGGLDSWTLRVIGTGLNEADYRNLVTKWGIRNVVFVGHVDPELHFEDASVYLHTAVHEGWGLTITEAMQKGAVPVVMNSSSVFADIIDDGRTGVLTEFGNVGAFTAALSGLMRDKALRERIAVAAITASHRHDLERVLDKWCIVLESLRNR